MPRSVSEEEARIALGSLRTAQDAIADALWQIQQAPPLESAALNAKLMEATFSLSDVRSRLTVVTLAPPGTQ